MQFKMLSAICFNLDQSKILLSGNGLSVHLRECSKSGKRKDIYMGIGRLIIWGGGGGNVRVGVNRLNEAHEAARGVSGHVPPEKF